MTTKERLQRVLQINKHLLEAAYSTMDEDLTWEYRKDKLLDAINKSEGGII